METILIVDDDQDIQLTISKVLQHEGYAPVTTGDGRRALAIVKKASPELVLLDIKLPDMDGMTVLEQMKQIDQDLFIIVLTAYGEIQGAIQAMKLGAFHYLTKPFDPEELILLIKKALTTQHLRNEVKSLRERLGAQDEINRVIGKSPQMQKVIKQVRLIAPTDMTVILQGESGTGKELIAKLIHRESLRKEKPFIPIDCGAIPEALVEGELFGYEKGAFTGADRQKKGLIEQAEGGTLFLDEVTNLSQAAQAKLLRVIEERKLLHLGGKRNFTIDVRIIAATNVHLAEALKQGKLREDLFHRLNEFQIALPPLRERKEDIPVLAQHFLDEANHELGKHIQGISPRAMQVILEYFWPGNVRELKHALKKAVLVTEAEDILPGHLPINLIEPQDDLTLHQVFDEGVSLEEITRRVERNVIQQALERAGGNKVKAAKLLHIQRRTLYRKMESLGM
jgi:DNA-binding NtrC family response regulator